MRVPITVPKQLYPKKDPEHPCACQFRPLDLQSKKGNLFWKKEEGDYVEKGEIICEGEVEKKTIEIPAPCSGILSEKTMSGEDRFTYGDILGYIEA